MFFEQLLLQIHQKYDGQRSVFSVFHLLKGKKSGQTIQDVGIFDLQSYFHLLPKLTKEQYTLAIEALEAKKLLFIDDQKKIYVTNLGQSAIDTNITYFNGWFFRGGEHLFFERLQLVVQAISNSIVKEKRFSPIVKDAETQIFVRKYLLEIQYNDVSIQKGFQNQLFEAINLMDTTNMVKKVLTYRLTGYKMSGWTWAQLVHETSESQLDLQIQYIHGLHSLIKVIVESPQWHLLQPLLINVMVKTVLTESTQKTVTLLAKGFSMEQIANMRRLKINTIEDHLAELAMYDPLFNIYSFVPKTIVDEIIHVIPQVSSKKLKPIKDLLPHITYFQIRLTLAWKGGQKNE